MTVAMRGALHKDHLQIDELDLGAFGGHALLAGEARWTPEESWALAGDVKGFNPAELRPGFNGSLDFRLKASGEPFGGDGHLDVAFSDLSGKLRGNAATRQRTRAQGRRGLDLREAAPPRRHHPPRASMATSAPKRELDLDFSIDADNLGLLAEGARGTLHARGSIAGTSGTPVIKLMAQGAGIEHRRPAASTSSPPTSMSTGAGSAPRMPTSPFRVSRSRNANSRSSTPCSMARPPSTHSRSTRSPARPACTSRARACFNDGVWNGTIADLFIDDAANINLQLDAPVAAHGERQGFRLDALCLHGKVARLCGEGAWNEAGWNARADATQPADQHAHRRTDPAVEYQGTVNATANLERQPAARRSSARRAPTWSTRRSVTSSPAAAPTSSVSVRVSSR